MSGLSTISPAGEQLVKSYEKCGRAAGAGRFVAYPDPATGGKPWTIGWGSTGPDVVPGLVWTQAQCDARFERDAQHMAAAVAELLQGAPTSQHQFDALVSLVYNVGVANLAASTLLKRHRAGQFANAQAEFIKWDHADKVEVLGLKRRRTAEAMLYAAPDGPVDVAAIIAQASKVTL